MSAATGANLGALRDAIFALMPSREAWAAQHALAPEPQVVSGPVPLTVRRAEDEPDTWLVTGTDVEGRVTRLARYIGDASEYLAHFFERAGLNAALKRAGAKEGDTVRIGNFAFEYFSDDPRRSRED